MRLGLSHYNETLPSRRSRYDILNHASDRQDNAFFTTVFSTTRLSPKHLHRKPILPFIHGDPFRGLDKIICDVL